MSRSRLDWVPLRGGFVLDVYEYRVLVKPAGSGWRWLVSTGETGLCEHDYEAKEHGVYHLRLSLDEGLPETQDALTYLDHLDDETDADRRVVTRGLKRRS